MENNLSNEISANEMLPTPEKSAFSFRSFFKYVSLNVIGMIGISCYVLADTFFVSRAFGTNGLAALNLTLPFYGFINGVGLLLGVGGGTRYKAYSAIGDKRGGDSVFTSITILSLLFGITLLVVGILFTDKLAVFGGANDITMPYAVPYLRTLFIFTACFVMNNVVLAFVRNDKNPTLSMIAMITGSISNILLDYVFMFPLKMGMFGAALATGIAPVISLAILSLHFIKKKNGFKFSIKTASIKEVFKTLPRGVSAFITELSTGIALIIFNLKILDLAGNVGVAAYGIIANISIVCISVFTGIAQGTQPLATAYSAKNDIVSVKKTRKYAVITALTLASLFYIFGAVFADGLISVFNSENNEELIGIAKVGIYIYFAGFLFAGKNIVSAAHLSAVGRPKLALLISLTRACLALIPLAFLLPLLFGLHGVWLSFVLAEAAAFLIALFGRIKEHRSAVAFLKEA